MKIRFVFVWLFWACCFSAFSQIEENDFKQVPVNRKVKEYSLEIDLSTPLSSYLSREYIMVSGKERLWHEISTYAFDYLFDANVPDKTVSPESQEQILERRITQVLTYKDSVASVISYQEQEGNYYTNFCVLEDGLWRNRGQNYYATEEVAIRESKRILPIFYEELPIVLWVKRIPTDTKPFVDYLKAQGNEPVKFLLDKLANHKLVIYGEMHRTTASWDLLRRLIKSPHFSQTTGTVFMELPSHMQPVMDQFLNETEIKPELLLDIMREEQPYGWWDKGEFDFLKDLWQVNRSLEPAQRIRVVLADYQIPYSRIQSAIEKDTIKEEDRNTHMANVIERHLTNNHDTRNNLFIIGFGHAQRSDEPGGYSTPDGMEPALTVGTQLFHRLPEGEVFITRFHTINIDNLGRFQALIRKGFFDRVFAENGNQPVAFDLKDSPFGREPYEDLDAGISASTSSFADRFDGYIFLGALPTLPAGEVLHELFTDDFIQEMKRRATYLGTTDREDYWFGKKADELTPDYIIQVLEEQERGGKALIQSLFEH